MEHFRGVPTHIQKNQKQLPWRGDCYEVYILYQQKTNQVYKIGLTLVRAFHTYNSYTEPPEHFILHKILLLLLLCSSTTKPFWHLQPCTRQVDNDATCENSLPICIWWFIKIISQHVKCCPLLRLLATCTLQSWIPPWFPREPSTTDLLSHVPLT